MKNLRVADVSAFALLPPGHPTSTVYGLAEKISADIIEERERLRSLYEECFEQITRYNAILDISIIIY